MENIKSGMKVGFNIKVAGEMLDKIEEVKVLVNDISIKNKKHLAIKKSIRVLKWDQRSGYDGDDFMRNVFTIVYTGKGYRIPRIVKRLYK